MNWKNKKLWIAGGAVAIVAVVLCIFLFAKHVREVSVIEVNGSVEVERPSLTDLLSAFAGMRLEEGDFIQTGEESNVTMTIDQNKAVKLAENSRASFDEVAEGKGGQITSIYLESGTLINDIKEKLSEDAVYKVNTPNATVSVRGTYFVVFVGPEEGYDGAVTKINVYDGSVKVENKNGEVVILYANEEGVIEGNGEEKIINSEIIVPTGNHALVGIKDMILYDYVDYAGLDAADLERLKAFAKEGKSSVTLEDIEAQQKKLTGQAEEEPTETLTVEAHTEEQTETEAATPIEKEPKPPKESTKDTEEHKKTEQPKTEAPGSGFIDAPVIEAVPVTPEKPPVKPPVNTGGGSSESPGGSSGEDQSTAPPVVPPAPPEEIYDSLQLQITNLTVIEGQMTDLQGKITIMEEIAVESGDTGWKNQVQQAKNDIEKTKTILDSVVTVNAVLIQINALPQPAQISENDRAGVTAARAAYEGLSADEKSLVPESSFKKITACEGRL